MVIKLNVILTNVCENALKVRVQRLSHGWMNGAMAIAVQEGYDEPASKHLEQMKQALKQYGHINEFNMV